ncbi:ribonuclease E activity regulator RraA [Glaciecola sp. KUL10]|uniref:ribonuclease E activity regulator RraA n=1 Tax=Glaciecola sp. (strain KUL10) TaxID=2161813 RepID=UPI000D78AE54|nr:ribonuclease E activity regulator RraA [Glaciecola sp. KUL10]GBL03596.1 ribonuclease activity regulator protein RraA [Glaciecola sp. KUL10]
MEINTSEICDIYADNVDVLEPVLSNFGGRDAYSGEVLTVKCFEDKGLVDKALATPGLGKVLVIDGGGSTRRALIDAYNAQMAIENEWEGIVCYGSVREVDVLASLDIGIHAIAAIPVNAGIKEEGEVDIPVNFAGVTFLPEDSIYADSTGVVLSAEILDLD